MAQTQPIGDPVADGAEAFADTMANRLQGLKPGATLGRMETDALGRTVIDGHEDAGRPLSPTVTVDVMSVPHITLGAAGVIVPSCAFGPCA